MADTPVVASLQVGSGPPFAADLNGSTYWPYAKIAWGPSGTQTELDDAASKRLPVKVGEGLSAVAVVAGQISLSGAEAALSTVAARRFKIRSLLTNTDVIYLGPVGVSAANGFPLWPGDWFPHDIELTNLNVLHAIVASGTQVLAYLGEV